MLMFLLVGTPASKAAEGEMLEFSWESLAMGLANAKDDDIPSQLQNIIRV